MFMVELGWFSAIFFPAIGSASQFRPATPVFLSRRMVRKLFPASDAPFLRVEKTPRPQIPGFWL